MAQFASTVTANVPLVNVSNTFNVFAAMQDNCIGLKHGGTNYFLVWVSTSNALNGAHIDPVSGACDGVINILPDNSLSAGYLGDIEYDSFSQNYFITSESYSSGNCSVLETIVNQGGAVVSSFTVVSNADILNPPRAASNPSAGQCLVAWGVTNQGVYGAVVSSAGINVSQFVIDASATLRGAPTASPAFDGANYLVVYKANTVSTSPAANALDTAVHSYVKGRFVSQSGSALNMAFTASIDPLITHYLPCAAYDKLNNLYIVTWSNWLYTPLAMTRAGYFDTSGRRLGDLFNTDFAAPGENVVVSEPHITSNGTTKTSSLGIMHGYFDTSKYPPVPAGSAYEGYDIEFIQ